MNHEDNLKDSFNRMWKLLNEHGELINAGLICASRRFKSKNFLFLVTEDEMDSSQITVIRDGVNVVYLNMHQGSYGFRVGLGFNSIEASKILEFVFNGFFDEMRIIEEKKLKVEIDKKISVFKWLKNEIIHG